MSANKPDYCALGRHSECTGWAEGTTCWCACHSPTAGEIEERRAKMAVFTGVVQEIFGNLSAGRPCVCGHLHDVHGVLPREGGRTGCFSCGCREFRLELECGKSEPRVGEVCPVCGDPRHV